MNNSNRINHQIDKQNLIQNKQNHNSGILKRNYDQNISQVNRTDKQKKFAYIKCTKNQNITQIADKRLNNKNNYRIQEPQLETYRRRQQNDKNQDQKQLQIQYLRNELVEQREKYQQFQQFTIKNQLKILQTISNLQQKLKQLKNQNNLLRQSSNIPKLQGLQSKIDQKQQQNHQLQKKYKQLKGIGNGLVDMMIKVDRIQCKQGQNRIKLAWKWIKKVVWQYQGIRKKAFQWKRAYDQLYNDEESSQNSDNQQN